MLVNHLPKVGERWPVVEEFADGTTITYKAVVTEVKAVPVWNWNPLRWLFNRPKFWDAEMTLRPQ